MRLFFEDLTPWEGERIDGVLYPLYIGTLWSDAQLEAIGLYRPLPADTVPEGKMVISTSPEWVEGVLKYVHVLEDEPPYFPDLTSRQFWLALVLTGHYDDVKAAIELEGLETVVEAEKASTFERYHPLVINLSPVLELSEAQLNDLWLWASTL
jgi:hypothetical protein